MCVKECVIVSDFSDENIIKLGYRGLYFKILHGFSWEPASCVKFIIYLSFYA